MNSRVATGKATSALSSQRTHLQFEGLVQGIGFRPALARLANHHQLTGWVVNTGSTVSAEIQGEPRAVTACLRGLHRALPAAAQIRRLQQWPVAPVDETGFEIRQASLGTGAARSSAGVTPPADVAPCPACLSELNDPANRRYRYPFIACAQCGPRDSIVLRLPYERANTTMHTFKLCPACQREYDDPADRRFHAQPIACPHCGPQVVFHDEGGQVLCAGDDAVQRCRSRLTAGDIVAVKGVGGFQLLVDARNEAAVARLRVRKHRPHKPFALLAADATVVSRYVELSDAESALLGTDAAPIVILRARQTLTEQSESLANSIAPGSDNLGFMLPASALHELIIRSLGFVLVATSANRSGDPMVTDNSRAFVSLDGIADGFLVHDRHIASPADDSVLRIVAGRPLFIRRARGYAPTVLPLPKVHSQCDAPFIAVGGHQKVTCAVNGADHILAGAVIGNMESPVARIAYQQQIARLSAMRPRQAARRFVCDKHPDYFTARDAASRDQSPIPVAHHLAHVAACMVDNQIDEPVLGVAFDGSGFGGDGTIRGGECFVIRNGSASRVASLLPFRLPGADRAVTEPCRSAIGLLHTVDQQWAERFVSQAPIASLPPNQVRMVDQMLSRAIHSPYTSSVGRLFDALASILSLHHRISYQGQAAMAVESAAQAWLCRQGADFNEVTARELTPFKLVSPMPLAGVTQLANNWLDWRAWLRQVIADVQNGADHRQVAFQFHQSLANAVLTVAKAAGQPTVVLSGGCFQNRLLTELTITALRDAGFSVFWHKNLPPNDESLAVGQLWWAMTGKDQERIS